MADVVYGSRFHGGRHRVLYFWHVVANSFLGLLSGIFTNLNLADVWSCYKVFPRRILEKIQLQEDRFGFEVEITAKLAKIGCRIYRNPRADARSLGTNGRSRAVLDPPPGVLDPPIGFGDCDIAASKAVVLEPSFAHLRLVEEIPAVHNDGVAHERPNARKIQ